MSGHAETIRINTWCGVAFDACFEDPPCDVCAMRAENQRLRDALVLAFSWIARQPKERARSEATCAYAPPDVYEKIREALAGDTE